MVNRFQDLLSAVPRGRFYTAEGDILPYRDAPYEFEFRTTKTSRLFLVFFNDITYGQVTTDGDGLAIVRTPNELPPGSYDIRVTDPLDSESMHAFITIRNTATWHAAHAEVIEQLDAEIDAMDAARSIERVTSKYIEDVYGRPLRQPRPSTLLHEDYRTLLMQLRAAYRHFGAHPYGLSQATLSFTSVDPLRSPKAWRPRWVLGDQLCPNGDLSQRTRMSVAEYAPTGAAGPLAELPDLNRQSAYYVAAPFAGTLTTFRQPPETQYLTITITDANRMTLTGVDERGVSIGEVVPDPSITAAAGTYRTQHRYQSLSQASKSGDEGFIGLDANRFVKVLSLGPYHIPGTALPLVYHGYSASARPILSWAGGPETEITTNPTTLRDIGRRAVLIGRRPLDSGSDTFNLNPTSASGGNAALHYMDRLYLDLDERGLMVLDLGEGAATVTLDDVVDLINDTLASDVRYQSDYADGLRAAAVTGDAGDSRLVLSVESPIASASSRVALYPGPCDAALNVFGFSRSLTILTAAADVNASTLQCDTTQWMPAVEEGDTRRQFDVRIRGLRATAVSGVILVDDDEDTQSRTMRLSSGSFQFSASDVGGYVRLSVAGGDLPNFNNGVHKIIGVETGVAFLYHERSNESQGFFDIGVDNICACTFTVWHKGQIVRVTDNDRTSNLLTVTPAPLSFPAGALVELVSDSIFSARGSDGIGEIVVEVDATYRPHHGFGDTITNVTGTTWRLASTRANFTGLAGRLLVLTDCQNLENLGPHAITAVTATTADFVLPNGGVEEGVDTPSNFEWSITDLAPVPISDDVTPAGVAMPDYWEVVSDDTTVTVTNESEETGYGGWLTPSRILLNSDENIQVQVSVPRALEYRGLPLSVSFWVQEFTVDATDYTIEVAFEVDESEELIFHEVVAQTAKSEATVIDLDTTRGPLVPFSVDGRFFVPYDASMCIIRLTRTPPTVAEGTMALEHISVRSETATGLALGSNTIPRSQKRAKFGELLFVWSAEDLEDEEKRYLGLSTSADAHISFPDDPGHIDYITNAHGYWERIDVSEVDTMNGVATRDNVRGVYDSTDWLATDGADGLVNMELKVGTPSRLTYVRPTRTTLVEGEELVMVDGGDGVGTARADLSVLSNHEGTFPQAPNTGTGTGARLFELRAADTMVTTDTGLVTRIPAGTPIPVPDTVDENGDLPWQFITGSQIRINSPYYEGTSSYVLDYDVLMRATGAPFELQRTSTVSVSDYVWLTDLAAYKRHNVDELLKARVEQARFRGDFTAVLTERADLFESATLERNNGLIIETVAVQDWNFLDSKTIKVDSGAFHTDSIYTIRYTARVPSIVAPVTLRFEWRAADTQADLDNDVVDWQEVPSNYVITPVFEDDDDVTVNTTRAWHQVRVTVTGVSDTRDFRIYGMGVKGLRMFGDNAYAPGLVIDEDAESVSLGAPAAPPEPIDPGGFDDTQDDEPTEEPDPPDPPEEEPPPPEDDPTPPDPVDDNPSPMGSNLEYMRYFSAHRLFTNLFMYAGRSGATTAAGSNTGDAVWQSTPTATAIDFAPAPDDQWPQSLVAGQTVATQFPVHETGAHALTFDGEGTITFQGSITNVVVHSMGHMTFDVTSTAGGFATLRITSLPDADNYITNISIVPQAFAAVDLTTQPHHPTFLERINPFRFIRCKDLAAIDYTQVEEWAQRTQAWDIAQSTEAGLAWEHQIELCNTTQSHMWVSLPHRASLDYVENLAELILADLNEDLNVYIEWSNEVWNTQFSVNAYATAQGLALGLSATPGTAMLRYQAQRSVQCFEVFEDVFGGTDRLVRIIAGQQGNAGAHNTQLTWTNGSLFTGTVASHTDCFSIAPYFGVPNSGAAGTAFEASVAAAADPVDFVLDYLEATGMPAAIARSTNSMTAATANGVRMIAYEGGQHLTPVGPASLAVVTVAYNDANRHPRMGALYTSYFDQWRALGGNEFANFNFCGPYTNRGSFPMMEYQNQSLALLHKYNAVLDWADDNPRWW